MPTLLQSAHSVPSNPYAGTPDGTYIFSPIPISTLNDGYILTSSNLYIPANLHPRKPAARSPDDILDGPWPDVRKAARAELNAAPTNALLQNSSTLSHFFSLSRRNAPLLYALHRELLTSIPDLSDLPAPLPASTLRFILRRLALFDDFLPDHLHFLPIPALISLIVYLSAPTFVSTSRLAAPQDEPVLFLARRHLINLSPTELESLASLPENPALYIIRRLSKRHLPRDQDFLKCLDRLAKVRYHKR